MTRDVRARAVALSMLTGTCLVVYERTRPDGFGSLTTAEQVTEGPYRALLQEGRGMDAAELAMRLGVEQVFEAFLEFGARVPERARLRFGDTDYEVASTSRGDTSAPVVRVLVYRRGESGEL